jgi:D-glycerate 3-kinase
MFELEGCRAVTISIDDFYLTRAEQIRLARENPGNRYLQIRGYPGTHDIALGIEVLTALKARTGHVLVPRYEKSLFEGKGDRLPRTSWKHVQLPLDFLFLEGWMLGFQPVECAIQDPALAEVNRRLHDYEPWYRLMDAFIRLRPKDYRGVLNWRVEAEEKMKGLGKPGMTRAEIRAYIETFIPAYELYLPKMSGSNISGPRLEFVIGSDRMPLSSTKNLK